MANRFESTSEGGDKFKSGHALLAFLYETEGEDCLLFCLKTWNVSRERAECYAVEYRKRGLQKLAEIMDNHAAEKAYSWDNPDNMPADSNMDYEYWRGSALRRHMMQVFQDDPAGYQAWLRGAGLAHA